MSDPITDFLWNFGNVSFAVETLASGPDSSVLFIFRLFAGIIHKPKSGGIRGVDLIDECELALLVNAEFVFGIYQNHSLFVQQVCPSLKKGL